MPPHRASPIPSKTSLLLTGVPRRGRSFNYNATTELYTLWDLSTTATPAGYVGDHLSAGTYISSSPGTFNSFNPHGFEFSNSPGTADLALNYAGASGLTAAGGTYLLGGVVG